MTRDEIEKVHGPELNVLVHTKVMGLETRTGLPPYASQIATTWRIVRLLEGKEALYFHFCTLDGEYHAAFLDNDDRPFTEDWVMGETPEEAICRAALHARFLGRTMEEPPPSNGQIASSR